MAETQGDLADCLIAMERFEAAEPMLRESLATLESHFEETDPRVVRARERLEGLYRAWEKPMPDTPESRESPSRD